jgi:hypothetical protein
VLQRIADSNEQSRVAKVCSRTSRSVTSSLQGGAIQESGQYFDGGRYDDHRMFELPR